jgi:demethylmenaquinone methyltransferase / 2-methoxy-6-polyprenyl-1,4-benzoquinol methylase
MDIVRSRTQPNEFARRLFAPLPARYNLLAEILSLGQNRRWRNVMVGHITPAAPASEVSSTTSSPPARVLDVAIGPGAVAVQLADRTSAYVVGIDLSEDMAQRGAGNISERGLSERITVVLGRAEQLPFPDATFDALTFTYLLRYVADPASTLAELARVVKPGGPIASLEFAVPEAPLWRVAWWGYTRFVLPVAGWATGGRGWYRVGRFLGPSISAHHRRYPIEWTIAAWERAGIERVETQAMSLGGGLVMWGRRAS